MFNTTPLKLNIPVVPLFAGSIFFVNIVVTYSLYWFEQRFAYYFPTVSETAIGTFNTKYFSSSMAFESYFVLISFYLILVWGETWNTFPKWFIPIGMISAFIMAISMIGVGSVTYENSFLGHMLFANFLFVLMWLFNLVGFILVWKKMHGCIFVTRIILLILTTADFVIFLSTNFITGPNITTINGITEVLFISFVIFMVFTWITELKSIDATFFVEE